jgi:hypothetical protein
MATKAEQTYGGTEYSWIAVPRYPIAWTMAGNSAEVPHSSIRYDRLTWSKESEGVQHD